MEILAVLSHSFMQRALITGTCIGVVCALLGLFLMLRRLSLIGDGLAHVTFGSVALGLFLNAAPLSVSVPVVMLASLGIVRLAEVWRIFGDAAIGIVSASGMAIGIILASAAGGFNIDLFDYLFGNILTISRTEVVMSGLLGLVVVVSVWFLYQDLIAISFDEEHAITCGIRARRINRILILLTAVTVVLAMKVVGTLLVSSLLIFPAASALQVANSFRRCLVVAVAASIFSVIAGIAASYYLNVPCGATIVMVNLIVFVAALAFNRLILK